MRSRIRNYSPDPEPTWLKSSGCNQIGIHSTDVQRYLYQDTGGCTSPKFLFIQSRCSDVKRVSSSARVNKTQSMYFAQEK